MSDSSLKISSNADDVLRQFRNYPELALKETKKAFRKESRRTNAELMDLTGENLNVRSGALRRGWGRPIVVGSSLGSLQVSFVNREKYAITHEEGKTITPKKSKFLAIPLDAAKTAAGVPRYSSPLRESGMKKTFIARSSAGNLILFASVGSQITPMFALVRSVTIPARLGAWKFMQTQRPRYMEALYQGTFNAWNKGK